MPKSRDQSWNLWLALLAVLLAVGLLRSMRSAGGISELVGQPLPPLAAEGWMNTGISPTSESLRGKVVLVDFWASWCGPCRATMPNLVDYRRRFRDQGVVVIGLTTESGRDVETVRQYVAGVDGLDWPIGYGAAMVFSMYGIDSIPTYILFDRSGTSIWASATLDGLEDATIAALAKE